MRTGVRILVVGAAIVLVPVVAPADVGLSCQRAVARGGAKFAKVALKIGQRCAMRAGSSACRLQGGGTSGYARVDSAIARATNRLGKRVAGACGDSDAARFATRCTRRGRPLDVAGLTACLRDTHLDRVGGLIAIEFPSRPVRPAKAGCLPTESCACACVSSPSGAFLATAADRL